jgi:hypothetical protein
VVEKVPDRPHPSVRYLRGLQAFDGLLGGDASEDGFDLLVQVVPVGDPLGVAREATVPGEGGLPEHGLAEVLPLPLVLNA